MTVFSRLARTVTHPRTTIGLFCATMASLMISELLPQSSIHSPAYFQELARSHPLLLTAMDWLALRSFSSSPWFLGLIALLALALTVTICQQAGQVLAKRGHELPPLPAISVPVVAAGLTPAGIHRSISLILRGLGYRPVAQPASAGHNQTLIFGKQRLGRFGSLFLHAGLLVLICAALGGYLFYSRGFIQIMAGETIPAGLPPWLEKEHGPLASAIRTNFAITVEGVRVALWPDRTRKWVSSTMTITRADGSMRTISPSLGAPVEVDGLTVYQSNHLGYYVTLIVKRPGQPGIPTHFLLNGGGNGKEGAYTKSDFPLTDYLVAITLPPDPRRMTFALPDPQASVTVSRGRDTLFMGSISPGERVALTDGNALYCQRIGPWSGITVVRGLALPLVYLGFALLVCGVGLLYFLSPREMRLRITPLPDTAGHGVTIMPSGGYRAPLWWERESAIIRRQLTALSGPTVCKWSINHEGHEEREEGNQSS